MVQIIFRGTTATTCVSGGSITTGNVQVLPEWAPPMEYVTSAAPWLVEILNATTYAKHLSAHGHSTFTAKIQAYGNKANLYDGRDCIALSRALGPATKIKPILIVSYRAVGELVKPL